MSGPTAPSLLRHVRRMAANASSDEQLLAEFLSRRSDEAFSALLGRHGPMVLNVCRRIVHDTHAAEDVFQATFLVLADRAGAIRRPTSLAGFLHGVASRLAVRARRRNVPSLPAAVSDTARAPWEALAWNEVLGILDQELDTLPDGYRAPLVLCYLEGRTQDEAARQLGWSLNTLRRRLTKGRQRLEVRLRGRGVTLPAALAGVLAAGAIAVPGPLRAATLAAVGSRVGAGLTAGTSAFPSSRDGIPLFLTASGKKAGVLVVLAALGVAISFGNARTPNTDQAQAIEGPLPPVSSAEGVVPDDPLPARGVVRFGTARYRHGTRIESMTISADGKRAVTTSGNSPYNPSLAGRFSPARVFDLTDGRCLYSLPNERGAYDEYPEAAGLSPDGKTLATRDGKFLYFRDATTGNELRRVKFLPDSGNGRSPTEWLTFTPDGKRVAVTMMGTAVHLIDVETGTAKKSFDIPAAARACVFSPDGTMMATGGYEQENGVYFARLWDVVTGKELRRFAIAHQTNRPIGAIAFSHDGTKFAGGSREDGRLRLFDVATGKELRAFPKIGEDIHGIAFAPDGKTVAAAGDGVYLYDPDTGTERLRIDRKARTLAFSPDGSVLTGAVSGTIYRWDAANGRQLTPAAGPDSAVDQIVVGADGRNLFTLDQDGDLSLWDATGKKSPRRIAGGIERGIVASADRRFLAWTVPADHGNSRIRLYDVSTERIIDPVLRSREGFKVIGGAATITAFLPDGKSLLTFEAGPASFRIWDAESWEERHSFAATRPKPVARNRATAPTNDFDEPVNLWNVATGKPGPELNEPLNVAGVPDEAGSGTTSYLGRHPPPFCTTRRAVLSPDGKSLAIGRDWAETFGNRRMKPMDGRAFSPDGRFLVDWAENPLGRSRMDHVYVWDATTGRSVVTLAAGPRPGATSAAFSPDGRTLATASADGIVRLWDVATWNVRAEFRGHRDRVTALAFGPDGRLYTGGLDTVVIGWDVRPPLGPTKVTLAEAWEALTDADGRTGFEAQGRFLVEPDKAVEWFSARVLPVKVPTPARVKALIADLDHNDFETRERATADLREQGPFAASALHEVVGKSPSAEVRRRVEGLLREIENGVIPPSELRALRAIEVLEWIATKEARTRLRELANGAIDGRRTREAAAASKRLEGRK